MMQTIDSAKVINLTMAVTFFGFICSLLLQKVIKKAIGQFFFKNIIGLVQSMRGILSQAAGGERSVMVVYARKGFAVPPNPL
jgi:hypothetical protein